uniref:Uncharacterized protein n=1 Tax=Vitis vinifera TaxID=29760 RepID=F6H8W3_VITVI|eukprot:XP_019079011.1 PREDICTED: uncharacterized protein LOC109123520 [Vitis vinifera]
MIEMLRRVPCFTDVELHSTKMLDFFPFTNRVLVSLGGDLLISITTQLPLGTPNSTVSRIQLLQDCMTQETAKVVVVRVRNLMRQRALLFELLEVVEALRAFITHRVGGGEELCIKLEQVESDLAAA